MNCPAIKRWMNQQKGISLNEKTDEQEKRDRDFEKNKASIHRRYYEKNRERIRLYNIERHRKIRGSK